MRSFASDLSFLFIVKCVRVFHFSQINAVVLELLMNSVFCNGSETVGFVTMCESFGCRAVIFGSLFLLFGLIGMLCMTAGYVVNTNFDNGLKKTTCTTLSSYVLAAQCSYSCFCNSNGKCQVCYYTCYNCWVVALIAGVTPGSTLQVASGLQSTIDATSFLSIDYPNNGTFTCYYNYNSTGPVNIYLNQRDAQSSFVAGLVFCGLAAAVLLVWIIIEIVAFLPEILDTIEGCCGACFGACGACFGACGTCRHNCATKLNRAKENRRAAKEAKAVADARAAQIAFEEAERKRREFVPTAEDYAPPSTQAPPSAPPLRDSVVTENIEVYK